MVVCKYCLKDDWHGPDFACKPYVDTLVSRSEMTEQAFDTIAEMLHAAYIDNPDGTEWDNLPEGEERERWRGVAELVAHLEQNAYIWGAAHERMGCGLSGGPAMETMVDGMVKGHADLKDVAGRIPLGSTYIGDLHLKAEK
jgi:hypothetical protein